LRWYTKAKPRLTNYVADVILIILGSLVYSLGLHCFTAPNGIAPGGVIGVATVVHSFAPLQVGTLYALFNLPLLIIGFIQLGKARMIKTVLSVAVITAATDFLYVNLPVYEGDKVLAALFGGALFGFGMGLIYVREGTSGGIDIVNRIINKKSPHLRMGAIGFGSDAVIIAGAMFAYRSIESGLYAIIAIFVSGRVIDLILYGSLEGKLLYIFSDESSEITKMILFEEKRGATILKGVGAYSGAERDVVCCAVQKNQYARIKRRVAEIDKDAFIIITNAGEVFGKGFSENDQG